MSSEECKEACKRLCTAPKPSTYLAYSWIGDSPEGGLTSARPRKSTVYVAPSDPPVDFEESEVQPVIDTPPEPPPDPNGYVHYVQMTPGTLLAVTDPYQTSPALWPDNGYHGTFHLSQSTRRSNFVSNLTQRHDPDGISWISPSLWANATWDGIPMNPCTNSASAIKAWMFPNANTMRGLRQRFYEVNPFTDLRNPTTEEIDSWNIEVIKLFRRLLGLEGNPITPLRSLYKRAQWTSEAKWEKRFIDGVATCVGSQNDHCGATYLPACGEFDSPGVPGQDNPAYRYPDEVETWSCITSIPGGSEGVNTINADLAWSIKLTRVIVQFLASDGLGSHTGPFMVREYVGMSFWYYSDGAVIFRGKWSGNLGPACPPS